MTDSLRGRAGTRANSSWLCQKMCLRVCGTAQRVPISSLKRSSLVQLWVSAAYEGDLDPQNLRGLRGAVKFLWAILRWGTQARITSIWGLYVRIHVSKDSARKKQRGREDFESSWEVSSLLVQMGGSEAQKSKAIYTARIRPLPFRPGCIRSWASSRGHSSHCVECHLPGALQLRGLAIRKLKAPVPFRKITAWIRVLFVRRGGQLSGQLLFGSYRPLHLLAPLTPAVIA